MTTKPSRLVIREAVSGRIIVDADAGAFQEIEGNWYVDPSAVDPKALRLTEHEYRCPYKGRCFYVDFEEGNRKVSRVAWVYDDVKHGWEHIRGKYGFYAGATARRLGKTNDDVT